MAQFPAHASAQLQDADGSLCTVGQSFLYDTSVTHLEDVGTWVRLWAGLLDAIVDARIVRAWYTVPAALGTVKTVPVVGAINERSGLFTFQASNTPNASSQSIPSLSPDKFVGDAIRLSDPGVAAYLAFVSTTSSTGIVPTDRYNNPLRSVRRGIKSFRGDR